MKNIACFGCTLFIQTVEVVHVGPKDGQRKDKGEQ